MSLPTITSLNDMGLRLLVWAWSTDAELLYTNDNSLGLQNMESYLFDRRNCAFGYFAENGKLTGLIFLINFLFTHVQKKYVQI